MILQNFVADVVYGQFLYTLWYKVGPSQDFCFYNFSHELSVNKGCCFCYEKALLVEMVGKPQNWGAPR